MAKARDFEGKNIQSAVRLACETLNIEEGELRYEVISHGATGIFGLVGFRKAKIRVALEAPAADAINDRQEATGPVDQFPVDTPVEASGISVTPGEAGGFQEGETAGDDPHCDPLACGKRAMAVLVDAIGGEAQVHASHVHNTLLFDVTCTESGMLIGKKGQTLEAVRYLVEKMVVHQSGQKVHVQVDVNGYRAKRKAALIEMAQKAVEKARRLERPATIGLLNPEERKIIHLSLRKERGVTTASKGDGYLKKVMVLPKRADRKPARSKRQQAGHDNQSDDNQSEG